MAFDEADNFILVTFSTHSLPFHFRLGRLFRHRVGEVFSEFTPSPEVACALLYVLWKLSSPQPHPVHVGHLMKYAIQDRSHCIPGFITKDRVMNRE